jgi:hypothetical protein
MTRGWTGWSSGSVNENFPTSSQMITCISSMLSSTNQQDGPERESRNSYAKRYL